MAMVHHQHSILICLDFHLAQILDQMHLERFANLVRQILEIALVLLGQDYG